MTQLSKTQSIVYHLYPGVIITAGFVIITPVVIRYGYPPQFGMMISIILIAIPTLFLHLLKAKSAEDLASITDLNGFKNHLPKLKLILYAVLLVIAAFIIWGITQPLDQWLTRNILGWLPKWYTLQNFSGYSTDKIKTTLLLNLVLNGLLAPIAEEFYFRGYLLPRMQAWGKYAFVVNTICFSLYHFWQPYVYITLILALLPLCYLVTKTRDIRLGIVTHILLNIVGVILSFGLLIK
ncbi:CPBP family intramembrane glutamic endopeptidase [Mucilaginibacter agri]|uniref:CPBP family intramembrane metalloprotease n=1 Tax=Mucilaginibacter agri TaxID=2695265 RepID=A0A965ZED4_9SPHI|nr:CPBP family intramembrane glutamic endopeptidase [Mucilaginibacter agri]NCD68683.1 CPBP family intramembrane metalloprotease [Mucilaginibacter agri]